MMDDKIGPPSSAERGGTFRIDSRRGAGTTVDVELPVGGAGTDAAAHI